MNKHNSTWEKNLEMDPDNWLTMSQLCNVPARRDNSVLGDVGRNTGAKTMKSLFLFIWYC